MANGGSSEVVKTEESHLREMCKELHHARKTPLLVIVTDPIRRFTAEKVASVLRGKNYEKLDILVNSPGGQIEPAYQIVKLFRRHARLITGIIPAYAKSAATLMCLGMEELILSELGELGPLDVQTAERQDGDAPEYTSALNHFQALEYVRLYTLETFDLVTTLIASQSGLKMSDSIRHAIDFTRLVCEPLLSQINPIQLGEKDRQNRVGLQYAISILTRYMKRDEDSAKEIAQAFTTGYPAHSFIIDAEELAKLGLSARNCEIAEENLLKKIRSAIYSYRDDLIELFDDVTMASKKNSAVNRKEIVEVGGGRNGSSVKNAKKETVNHQTSGESYVKSKEKSGFQFSDARRHERGKFR